MLGAFLALLAAAAFAFNNVSVRRGVVTGSVLQAIAVTVPIGVPLFLAASLAAGSLGAVAGFAPPALLWLALAGVAHFVWGRYCNYRALAAMGSNLAGPVQQTSLLVSLGLAVGLLGEALTLLRILGIVLVVLGPAIIARSRKGARASSGRAAPAAFRPRYAEGYLFGVLSAVGYGVSPVLVRAALEGAEPGVALAGALVSYAAATAVILPLLLGRRARRQMFDLDRRAARWFALAGLAVFLSQMLRYLALALAPVAVVAPLLRTSIAFRVLFAWFVNREHEVFHRRLMVGVALSLLGALALTLDTGFVLSLLSLPDAAAGALRWQWPAR